MYFIVPYLLIELLSSLVVLENSLVEVFLECIFILSMNNDSVLRLSNFLAANKGSTTLAEVLRVSRNNVFWVYDLISIAIVNGCSHVYKNKIIIILLETLLGSYFCLP